MRCTDWLDCTTARREAEAVRFLLQYPHAAGARAEFLRGQVS